MLLRFCRCEHDGARESTSSLGCSSLNIVIASWQNTCEIYKNIQKDVSTLFWQLTIHENKKKKNRKTSRPINRKKPQTGFAWFRFQCHSVMSGTKTNLCVYVQKFRYCVFIFLSCFILFLLLLFWHAYTTTLHMHLFSSYPSLTITNHSNIIRYDYRRNQPLMKKNKILEIFDCNIHGAFSLPSTARLRRDCNDGRRSHTITTEPSLFGGLNSTKILKFNAIIIIIRRWRRK